MGHNFDIETVIGFESLYESMNKCRKGVIWKDSVASFCLNGIERCTTLSRELHIKKYKARPPIRFTITSPKPRDIASITFRDRVYQRSLNDNVVYPIMCKSFIYDNYACQKGKGTDFARNRLKQYLQKYYRLHGHVGYVAQFDIHGYYPNMDHDIAESNFASKLPNEVYKMVETILHEQYTEEKGYNPGSQLIQIAGISVLDKLDHYIKEELRARFYVRYMDDFIIFSEDQEYLEQCSTGIEAKLNAMRFELNKDKTKIYPLEDGIYFLGFKFLLTETGKVLMLIKSENVKRERKKLRRLVEKSKRGFLPKCKVDESYLAWRNHASKGNCTQVIMRMDAYYKSLWG